MNRRVGNAHPTNNKLNYIGVIGDVHCEDELLKIAVNFLKQKDVEEIFCVGDIADGTGDINRCCNILKEEKIITVMGNHDRWLLNNKMRSLKEATLFKNISQESKELIQSLPVTVKFSTHSGSGLLCHGLAQNDMAKVSPYDYGYAIESNTDLQKIIRKQKYNYIINGHTHKRMVRKFGNITIINAGTLKSEHEPCFLIVDFKKQIVQFFEIIKNNCIREIEKVSLSKIL